MNNTRLLQSYKHSYHLPKFKNEAELMQAFKGYLENAGCDTSKINWLSDDIPGQLRTYLTCADCCKQAALELWYEMHEASAVKVSINMISGSFVPSQAMSSFKSILITVRTYVQQYLSF